MKISTVTIVCQEEVELLKIQAHTFGLYMNPADVEDIIVLVNNHLMDGSETAMPIIEKEWWGPLQDRVKLFKNSDLGFTPLPHIHGWYTQQIGKLLGATATSCPWAVVFDAKTWLIRTFDLKELYDSNEKPCVGSVPVSHFWQDARQHLESMFNIKIPSVLGPSGVPFFFHTPTVKELIDSIPNFCDWFQKNVPGPYGTKNLITEFMLYSAYLIKRDGSFESLYNTQPRSWEPANLADWELAGFDAFVQRLHNPKCLTASIKRKCYEDLTPSQINRWLDFLETKQVIQPNQRNYVDSYSK